MSTTASIGLTVAYVSRQIALYAGQTVLIAGVVGGLLNLVVFLSLKTFRQSSCAFYFIMISWMDLGQLLTGYLTRIMITGYGIDWTQTSIIYCKLRWYLFQTFTLSSYAYMCLATIDQYLATSTNRRWQQWSNIRVAHRLSIITFIPIILHGIPSIIYSNHISTSVPNRFLCILTNNSFQRYRTYGFNLVLAGVVPVFITAFFGFLAYSNVKQIAYRTVPLVRRELDKQLTAMVLVQVIYISLAIIPYTLVIIIMTNLDLQNNPTLAAQLQLGESVGAIIYYSYFATPFYIYITVSKRFRQQFIFVLVRLFKKCRRQPFVIHNQVSPESETH